MKHPKSPLQTGPPQLISSSCAGAVLPTAAPAAAPVATTFQGGPSATTPQTRILCPFCYKGPQIQLLVRQRCTKWQKERATTEEIWLKACVGWMNLVLETVSPDDIVEARRVLDRDFPRPGTLRDEVKFKINYLIGNVVCNEHRAEFVAKADAMLKKKVPKGEQQVPFLLDRGKSWVESLLQPVPTPLSSIAGAAGLPSQGPIRDRTRLVPPPRPCVSAEHGAVRTELGIGPNEKTMLLAPVQDAFTDGTMLGTGTGSVDFRRLVTNNNLYFAVAICIIVGLGCYLA